MPTLTIEKACEDDRPAILRLLEQANMHHIGSEEMPELVDGIASFLSATP